CFGNQIMFRKTTGKATRRDVAHNVTPMNACELATTNCPPTEEAGGLPPDRGGRRIASGKREAQFSQSLVDMGSRTLGGTVKIRGNGVVVESFKLPLDQGRTLMKRKCINRGEQSFRSLACNHDMLRIAILACGREAFA